MNEQIFVQINDERIELTGADRDAFIAQREADQIELEARQNAEIERATQLASAMTKLKALGLTEAEAKIIIGLE